MYVTVLIFPLIFFNGIQGSHCNGTLAASFRLDNLQLPCTKPLTLTSKWMKNEDRYLFVAGGPVANLKANIGLNVSTNTLTIDRVDFNDEGIYTCKDNGEVVRVYYVEIHGEYSAYILPKKKKKKLCCILHKNDNLITLHLIIFRV